jgi:hypothetical protein
MLIKQITAHCILIQIGKVANGAYFADDLCYQKSWDWLMPVVEKIEGYGFSVFIHNDGCYIKPTYYFGNFPAIGNIGDSKIGATYKAVLAFINWYNTKS